MRPRYHSIQHQLSDYIDHAISGRQISIVAAHLRVCSVCEHEFDPLLRTTGLLNYYVESLSPGGYYDRFWRGFQCRIEQRNPRPIWSRVSALCRSAFLSGEDLFNEFVCLFEMLVGIRSRAGHRWGRFAPFSALGVMIISVSFVVTQLIHLPERSEWAGTNQLRSSLKAYPVELIQAQGNRELVDRRDRVLALPQVLSHQVQQGSHKVNHQFDTAEIVKQDWGSYSRLGFVDNCETLRELTDNSDDFRDMLAFAQLSAPGSALAAHDFSGPVGINSPFPDKFEREGPQLNAFVGVLRNVAVRDLSLAEVCDSVKL